MSEHQPAGRGILGVRKAEVERLIAERDAALQQAEVRIQAAEARVTDVEAELRRLEQRNEQLERQIEELRSLGDREGERSDAPELTPRFLSDELGTILSAAEESATRIMERARQATEQRVAEAERAWGETQTQIARFAAWRDRVEPLLRSSQVRIEEVRTRIQEVPDQIRRALVPLADAVASLDGDLADVSEKANPPRLVTPTAGQAPGTEEPSTAEPPGDEAAPAGG